MMMTKMAMMVYNRGLLFDSFWVCIVILFKNLVQLKYKLLAKANFNLVICV